DRIAPTRSAARPAARQRPLPDARMHGGEISFEPPSRFTSLDHLVGAGEQHRRHSEAKHPPEVERLFRVRDDAPNGGHEILKLDRFGIELIAARGNSFLALAR